MLFPSLSSTLVSSLRRSVYRNHQELHGWAPHSTHSFFDRSSDLPKSHVRSFNLTSSNTKRRDRRLDGLPPIFPVCTTKIVKTSSDITSDDEQALRARLVMMYLEEEGLKVARAEHWSRSETELNWLKMGARKRVLRLTRRSVSSLQHQFFDSKFNKNPPLYQILLEWVDQYVSQKKPLAYILGDVPFGNLTLSVRPPILIPRSETEEWVLKLSRNMGSYFQVNRPTPCFKVLDIGTGSGCISNYLAYHHQQLHAVGVDIHQDAVGLARENASIHQVLFPKPHRFTNTSSITKKDQRKRSCSSSTGDNNGRASFYNLDLFSPTFTKNVLERSQSLTGFDMIVSNPPYITHSDYLNLPDCVKNWESPIALLGDRKFTPIDSHPSLSRGNQPCGEYGYFTSSYRSSSIDQKMAYTQFEGKPNGGDEEESSNLNFATKARNSSSSGLNIDNHGIDFYQRIIDLVSMGGLLKNNSNHGHHHAQGQRAFDQEDFKVSKDIPNRLPKIVFEVGDARQAKLVKETILLRLKPPQIISHVEIWTDYSGIERTVLAY